MQESNGSAANQGSFLPSST